ncbi:MAG: tRNA (adenosine(37)-N6)-threonylcarbamoyltransferase complex dimerization subunit type 1 TsaB [Gammaproteobacteria bacterium]|nr:tRNA (adenosine(37)-N6)-threonylcarbamoyltransferase complex dimerization subunit type 1 TsaB [Gammaproteobacteria bacterium]
MKLLAIDTSTIACSAALFDGGDPRERFEIAPREHADLLLPMVDALLAEAGWSREQIDVIAFGRGPGAFTGLRIAAGVAQGIAFGLDIPVVPVSTLAALAHGAMREGGGTRVLAAMDARMREIYWGAYELEGGGRLVARGAEQVCAPMDARLPVGEGWFGAGDAWDVYGDILRLRLGPRLAGWDAGRYPRARDIALLAAPVYMEGGGLPPEQALPVYLRDNVAQPKKRKPSAPE